jgi:hypothetical protein
VNKKIPYDERYKVSIPEGISGDWEVRKITISEEQSKHDMMRGLFNGHGRYARAGTFTQLRRSKTIIMSDTHDEIRDHLQPIDRIEAHGGHVIIAGLGIGMVAAAAASCSNVSKVTVVEMSEDVIKLVEPTLMSRFGDKIEIIHADALKYKPAKGLRFSVAWHDIWDSISADNLPDMAVLNRRYGQRAEWQGAWAQDICKRLKREENSWRF